MSSNWSKFNLAKHYQMIVLPEGTGERCRGIYNQYLSSCCRAISAPVLPWMELLCCYLRPALCPGALHSPWQEGTARLCSGDRPGAEVSMDTGKISACKELSSPGAAAQAKAEALFLLKMKYSYFKPHFPCSHPQGNLRQEFGIWDVGLG